MNDKYVNFDSVTELVGREMFTRPALRRYRAFDVPDFGRVRIQSFTEREMSAYQAGFLDKRGEPSPRRIAEMRRRIIALCVVDGDGDRLLTDQDADAIGNGDSAVMGCIQEEIQDHINFGSDDDLEELAKNSEEIHADASPTS